MGIGFATVRNMMKSVTDAPISDKAVHLVIQYLENQTEYITCRAIEYHSKQNELRNIQGLNQKKRLEAEEIKEVIKDTVSEELIGCDIKNETNNKQYEPRYRTQPSRRGAI